MFRYRILISIFAIVMLLREGLRRFSIADPKEGAHLWLHGASNGELTSFRVILERLISERPDLNWLITTNSPSGREMVEAWNLPRVSARLAPVDLFWTTKRIMRRWNIVGHITLESEIWPHRILQCPGPVLLLGARFSENTVKLWRKLGGFSKRIFGRLSLASAQDPKSERGLLTLGMPIDKLHTIIDFKSFYKKADVDILQVGERYPQWLAASTHEEEEAFVIEAHVLARQNEPDLRLIIAPRHPKRGEEIRSLALNAGLSVSQRSKGEDPGQTDVYLADTLGEMPLWYASSGRVFIGGTVAKRGGHTPYEPAAYACALIFGPDQSNFRAAFGKLKENQCGTEVTTPVELARALNNLADPKVQDDLGQAVKMVLKPSLDAEAVCQEILNALG